ncbi:hypothetical protein C2E23DRAFT_47867 [Lenzites betulinus]|nr:hypothetical protein C2E23DRAFT_47867 [Lenzites betulinus]
MSLEAAVRSQAQAVSVSAQYLCRRTYRDVCGTPRRLSPCTIRAARSRAVAIRYRRVQAVHRCAAVDEDSGREWGTSGWRLACSEGSRRGRRGGFASGPGGGVRTHSYVRTSQVTGPRGGGRARVVARACGHAEDADLAWPRAHCERLAGVARQVLEAASAAVRAGASGGVRGCAPIAGAGHLRYHDSLAAGCQRVSSAWITSRRTGEVPVVHQSACSNARRDAMHGGCGCGVRLWSDFRDEAPPRRRRSSREGVGQGRAWSGHAQEGACEVSGRRDARREWDRRGLVHGCLRTCHAERAHFCFCADRAGSQRA